MLYEIARASLLGNRKINQDRLAVVELGGCVLMILGDGLGGKAGGEFAAQMLIDTVTTAYTESKLPIADPEMFLADILKKAHHNVVTMGKESDPPIEPGTTAVICLVQNEYVWWAHVGDSRFYLFRNGLPLYRTQDDSYVERLYQQGQISLEKRHGHPMRNYVTQCIGYMSELPKGSVSKGVALQEDDVLLLCSDGLWEPLDDVQLGALITERHIKEAINKLAERVEQASYPNSDNISAVALHVMTLSAASQITQPDEERDRPSDSQNNALSNAIEEIRRTFKKYRHEMDK